MKPYERPFVPDVGLAAFAETCGAPSGGDGVGASEFSAAPPAMRCPAHPDAPIASICVDHLKVLCADCVGARHVGHNVKPVGAAKPALLPALQAAAHTCSNGAQVTLAVHTLLQRVKDGMATRKTASIAALHASAASLKAAVDSHTTRAVAAVEKEYKARVKQLDTQLDALIVSANQLACVTSACSQAAASSNAVYLVAAFRSATRAASLITPFRGPVASSFLDVVTSEGGVLKELTAWAKVRTGLARDHVACEGTGVRVFRLGQENKFTITVKEGTDPIDSLSPEDVTVYVTAARSAGRGSLAPPDAAPASVPVVCMGSVAKTRAGVFTVTYVVPDTISTSDLRLTVNVAGYVHEVQLVQLARVIDVSDGEKYGMAVSHDERWLVCSEFDKNRVWLHDITPGSSARPRKLGGPAPAYAPCMFSSPMRVCFVPTNGNFLVVDTGNNRVQEFTSPGAAHVRSTPVACPRAIACNGIITVIGNSRTGGNLVELYDYTSHTLLKGFGTLGSPLGCIGSRCEALRISPDGLRILAVEAHNRRLSLFDVSHCAFVSTVAAERVVDGIKDADFLGPDGDIVVTELQASRVTVFTRSGVLARSWGSKGSNDGQLRFPSALAVVGPRIYVMDSDYERVQVFL